MHVILDEAHVEQFKDKYTLLELDSFRVDHDKPPVTAWCVLEQIPVMEMMALENHKNLHHELMNNYRKRDWSFCEQALEHLSGKWNGEVDSFYDDIHSRIQKFKEQEPDADWDGIIDKTA
jgi:hypothetical protein